MCEKLKMLKKSKYIVCVCLQLLQTFVMGRDRIYPTAVYNHIMGYCSSQMYTVHWYLERVVNRAVL